MKILVVGLGNPILGDDAAGWRVAEQVELQLQQVPFSRHAVEVVRLSVGGLRLMETLEGYDYTVIVDAISTGKSLPGTVTLQRLEEFPDLSAGHTTSPHDTSLQTAMRFARQMGVKLPEKVDVVTIEAKVVDEFSEQLTPEVAEALPRASQMVLKLIESAAVSSY